MSEDEKSVQPYEASGVDSTADDRDTASHDVDGGVAVDGSAVEVSREPASGKRDPLRGALLPIQPWTEALVQLIPGLSVKPGAKRVRQHGGLG